MKARLYPDWALPNLMSIGMDYRQARGILGGVARKANLTRSELRRIAMKGYRAYLGKMTPAERSAIASHAAKIGNAKRWAGHTKAAKPRLTPEQRSEVNRRNGRRGNEVRWGALV
jgi:hypothetical protein